MAKRLMKYNPAFLTESELVNSFVVRTTDLELIMDVIRDNTDAASNQHVLLIGPRGIGKTTLVLRVAAEVGADEYLRDNWYPLVFGEEAYEVSTPGEFWLEALFHLARQTGESMWQDTYLDLKRETDESRLRERALAQLMDFADQQKKRILLVVENLHMLLGDQVSDDDAWVIRHTLVNEPRLMLLATAANRFHSIDNSSQAMFELFKIHELEPLSNDDSRTLWEAVTGEELVGDRIRPIRILTGGNPRLLTIIAGFAMRSSFRELTTDLVDLVDDHTDYFKSHLDYLPPQERKVFVALADIWDPATASEVAAVARIPVNKVSAHLSRLVNSGAVVVVDQSKGKKWYELAERMYNIYHLMRRRGNPSARVEAIIQFMVHFYEAGDLAKRIAEEAVRLPCELREEHFQAYRAILEHARSLSDRCKILEITPQQFLESPDMPDEIRQIIEASRIRGGAASNTQSQVLPSEKAIRERLFRASSDPQELVNIGQELETIPGGSTYAEEAYRMLTNLDPASGWGWVCLGNLYAGRKRYDDAEQALRTAVEREPDHPLAWGILGQFLRTRPGRQDEAECMLQHAVDLDPRNACLQVCFGKLYQDVRRYVEAEEAFRQATDIEPSYAYTWTSLGQLFEEQTRYAEAEHAYRKANEVEPDYGWAWIRLGKLHERQNQHQEAEEAYRRAIELEPSNSLAWASLIGMLIARPDRSQDAIDSANECLSHTNHSAQSLDDLAWEFTANWPTYANYALSYAKEAVEQEPEDPGFSLTLALILTLNGDSKRALELAPLVLTEPTLVRQQLPDVLHLFASAAARGLGVKALGLVEGSASEQALEPLIYGLRMFLGEKVNVAQEIKEIAEDIVASIRKLQEEIGGPS